MTLISMIVPIPPGNSEILHILKHMQSKHENVRLTKEVLDNTAYIELTCQQDMLVRNAAAEIKRGLKINNCRVWHEHVMRGTDA